jgi:hypothetical protein
MNKRLKSLRTRPNKTRLLSPLGSREVIPLCKDARACSATLLMLGDLVWRDVPDSTNWAVRVAAVPLGLPRRADFFRRRQPADVHK